MINMDLRELYLSIDNTLTDDTVDKLIDIYSEKNGNVYKGLSYYNSKDIPKYNNSVIESSEKDKFFSNCFNIWKRNVLSMSKEEFKVLLNRGSFDRDFIKLRNYLLNVPDIHSYKEMNDLYYGSNTPDDIKDLFEKYGWDSLGAYSGWVHTDSRTICAKRTPRNNVEHRLYINSDSMSLYRLINLFMKECSERNIPFYFKFDLDNGARDDTLPIYSDSEHLIDYIEILKDIKQKHPEINFYEPPLLAGKIDNFIGYGSEPDERVIGKRESFNNIRAEMIKKSIKNSRDKWIRDNINTNFGSNDKPRSITQIITMRAVKNYIDDLKNRYNNYVHMEQNRRKVTPSNVPIEQEVYSKLFYTPQMLDSVEFKNKLYYALYNSVDNYYRNNTNNNISVDININGKNYNYSQYEFDKTLDKLPHLIRKHDSNFRYIVKDDIRNNCSKYGIMPDKFCCDYTRVQSMKQAYKPKKREYVALTDEEIEISRRKISDYKEPQRRYSKEEMEALILGDSVNKGKKNDKVL